MAKKLNRTCICCGHKYSYCPSCGTDAQKPLWMAIYHNENCKDLFMITTDYKAGILTKEQAKDQYKSCDMSYRDKIHHSINESIIEVCGDDSKQVTANKTQMIDNKECKQENK